MRDEVKDEPSKEFLTVDGIGTGHEAQNPACQKLIIS